MSNQPSREDREFRQTFDKVLPPAAPAAPDPQAAALERLSAELLYQTRGFSAALGKLQRAEAEADRTLRKSSFPAVRAEGCAKLHNSEVASEVENAMAIAAKIRAGIAALDANRETVARAELGAEKIRRVTSRDAIN
jgi:hypothetical protein